jgi:hypothetical protein
MKARYTGRHLRVAFAMDADPIDLKQNVACLQ